MQRREFLAASAAAVVGAGLPVVGEPEPPTGLTFDDLTPSDYTNDSLPVARSLQVFFGDTLIYNGPVSFAGGKAVIDNQSGITIPAGAALYWSPVCQSSPPAGE